MTDSTEIEEIAAEPEPKRRETKGHYLAVWLLLVLLVGTYIARNQLTHTPESGPEEAVSRHSVQMTLIGRYVVGVKSLGMDQLLVSGKQNAFDELIKQVKTSVQNDADRVVTVIVIAEVLGVSEAESYIDALKVSGDLGARYQADLDALGEAYAGGSLETAVGEAEMPAFKERYGWFADLALVFGLPNEAANRQETLKPARTMLAGMVGLLGVLGLFGLLGFGLFLTALILGLRGRLTYGYHGDRERAGTGHIVYFETLVLFLAFLLVVPMVMGLIAPRFTMFAYIVLLAFPLWLRRRGLDWGRIRAGLGLHSGRGVFREALSGIGGYFAGLPIVAIGFFITLALIQMSGAQPSHPIADEIRRGGGLHVAQLFFFACIIAPILEETSFRGAFYHFMRRDTSVLVSALTTGLVFGLIHPQGFAAVPVLASLGVVFALIREWRGSIIGPMVAHGLNNSLVLTLSLILLR